MRGGAAAAPRKAPISPGFCCVALERPGANLIDDRLLVRDSPVETLGGEHAEFGFGEVEPASVLGRVMPFEPLDEPTRFGGGKSFVERSRAMGVEIVLDEHDPFGVREMRVGEVLERVCLVDVGAMVGHLDMAPAFERRVHHERIGRAAMVITLRLAHHGATS